MAKFKVCIQQFVEKVAVIEVDAADADQARAAAAAKYPDADWKDGDDAQSIAAYAVLNGKDQLVWER